MINCKRIEENVFSRKRKWIVSIPKNGLINSKEKLSIQGLKWTRNMAIQFREKLEIENIRQKTHFSKQFKLNQWQITVFS